MATFWWFVMAAGVLGYSWAVPKGLALLEILSWIVAAGLILIGITKSWVRR